MIKFITLLFLSSTYLLSAGFWTLSGVTKANIYVQNGVSSLKRQTISTAKDKIKTALTTNGIKTNQQDAPTIMLELESIEEEDTHYIYVKLALGEEVKTYRVDKSETFAITYLSSDFIDVDADEMDSEVLESVDFLLSQFIEQFEEDKE